MKAPNSQNHTLPDITEEMDFYKKAKLKRTLEGRNELNKSTVTF